MTTEFIETRRMALSVFLNRVVRHPSFISPIKLPCCLNRVCLKFSDPFAPLHLISGNC